MASIVLDDESISWWHGEIARSQAEYLLKNANCPSHGAIFLVRESKSAPGDCVLSLYDGRKIYHHQICRFGDDAFFGIDDSPPTHGLEILISNLQKNSTFGIQLVSFVKKEPPPDLLKASGRSNILHKVIKLGDRQRIEQLFDCEYKFINAKDTNGKTAVHLICKNKNVDSSILQKLIDRGANVNTYDLDGNKPIHYACLYRDVDIVQMLINCNVDLQQANLKTGNTPLHEAAKGGKLNVVNLLLKNGAAIRSRNFNKEFPISGAINYNHTDIAKVLNTYVQNVKTTKNEWYHEKMDRTIAKKVLIEYADKYYEEQLHNQNRPDKSSQVLDKKDVTSGIFLVRSSVKKGDTSQSYKYVISMLYKDEFKNYEIFTHGKYYYLESGPYMDSLEHLVDYYSKYSDGIPVRLKQGVKSHKKPSNNNLYPVQTIQDRIIPDTNTIITNDNLTILTDYELGSGAFGNVYQGIVKTPRGNLIVAVKTLNEENKINREDFLKEANIMHKLRHICIVNILGILENPDLMIVQEYMSKGGLLEHLRSVPDTISQTCILQWASQIACGMKYLESQKCVHRDLAARNILMESEQQIKISDFGLSRAVGADKDYYRASAGGHWPVKWYAIESFMYGEFSHLSDVWSYGVTLWEIYSSGAEPYEDEIDEDEEFELTEMITDGTRLGKPNKCPDNVFSVMQKCWSEYAEDRPKFCWLFDFFESLKSSSEFC